MATRLPRWLIYCLVCMALWGVWGVLAKVAAGRMTPADEQILYTFGSLPLAAAALGRLRFRLETDRAGAAYGVLNGVCAGVGMLAYYAAMARGPASVVSTVTALFPLLTVFLAMLALKERINRVQAAGVVAALAAIVLLAG